ncbi:MAG: carbohydrate kinase family protein [Phycicoccus sp.]|nr:carbohydrate kinase family protein [Phycicoccus sp.]
MPLTSPERAVLTALRRDPLLPDAALAGAAGLSESELQVAIDRLVQLGQLRGRGWLLRERDPVVVVGGAVLDRKIQAGQPLVLGSSNPGFSTWGAGGVGRNIAEGLARLGRQVELIAPVSNDPAGQELLTTTRAAGVGVTHLISSPVATGQYIAVLDQDGELVVGLSDMSATDTLTVRMVSSRRDVIGQAELLVIDGNLPTPVAGWLLDFAGATRIPVVLDPVSVAKARLIAGVLDAERPVLALTPNVDEMGAMIGSAVANDPEAIAAAATWFHDRGVVNLWVHRGADGSVLSTRPADGSADTFHLLAAPAAAVVDVTGAGDAMAAGFIHSWLDDGDAVHAAEVGQMVAALTVEVPETVRPDLTAALLAERLDDRRLR